MYAAMRKRTSSLCQVLLRNISFVQRLLTAGSITKIERLHRFFTQPFKNNGILLYRHRTICAEICVQGFLCSGILSQRLLCLVTSYIKTEAAQLTLKEVA